MAKKRLNKDHREQVISWMIKEKIEKVGINKELNKLQLNIIDIINVILRKYYPEEDMIILRKYKLSRQDICLKFSTPEGGLFTIDFDYRFDGDQKIIAKEKIVDIVCSGGCYNNTVFETTNKLRDLYNSFDNLYNDLYKKANKKESEYRTFINNCKYLEEVEAIVTLPDDIREYINGKSTAITIINPDLITSIKEDFKCK